MPNLQSPAERYRRLAQECIDAANTFPEGEQRKMLIQMAQVWQRLADQHADGTVSLSQPSTDAAQQQQQVQPKDEDEKP